MRALLPLALLLATGCYTPRAIPSESSQADPYGGWYQAPLEATLWYHEHDGYASFQVNRPASVAIFAMRPGGGMEMIYPRSGYGGGMQFSSGRHIVRTGAAAAPLRMASNWSMAYGASPMYILMVASEDPLDVNAFRFAGHSWFTRSTLTHSPYYAMEALVDEVVRNPSAGRWTTAMQVVWPSGAWPNYNREQYKTIRCVNGVFVTVPARALYLGLPVCPGDEQQAPDADSTEVKDDKGTPVRPDLPPGWMNTDLQDRQLKEELRRIRALNGRSGDVLARRADLFPPRGEAGGAALGVAERRPAASWPAGLERPARTRAGIWPGIDSPPARQPATRSRPARPSTESQSVRRPSNPRPQSRPAAQPRSRPDPKPVRRPPRAPEPRPTPSKPKPDND